MFKRLKTVSVLTILSAVLLLPLTAMATYSVGDTVADWTLYDAYGQQVSLYDYKGMVVFLTFWTPT